MRRIPVIVAQHANQAELDFLREEVEKAKVDPDYAIITNFRVHTEWVLVEEEDDGPENILYAGLHHVISHPLLFYTRNAKWAVRLHKWTAKKAWPEAYGDYTQEGE